MMMAMNSDDLFTYTVPHLYDCSDLLTDADAQPVTVPPSAAHLDPTKVCAHVGPWLVFFHTATPPQVYILDSVTSIMIWIGRLLDPALMQATFNSQSLGQVWPRPLCS